MSKSTTAIIGAGGFVGRALARTLLAQGPGCVRLFNRTPGEIAGHAFEPLPSVAADLTGVGEVVHLAGIVHYAGDDADYQTVNVELPLSIARIALDAGVNKFVFASSLSVTGHWNTAAATPDAPFAPRSPYGASKVGAEQALRKVLQRTPTRLRIFRPPLVYGPGSRTKFGAFVRAAKLGLPLPTGLARARRSMVSLTNLTDAIIHLCRHENSDDMPLILLPADDRDLMVCEVYKALAQAAGKSVWQVPVPPFAMHAALGLTGREEMFDSLFRPSVIDRSHWSQTGWAPPQSVEDGLREAMA